MIYMAGDNSLSNRCVDDLRKLKLVGSREKVLHLVVQVDRSGRESQTKRYYIKEGDPDGPLDRDVDENICEWMRDNQGARKETDTGSAQAIKDFVLWSIDHYRAEHYVLIFWGHARVLDAAATPVRLRRNALGRRGFLGNVDRRSVSRETGNVDPPAFFIVCPDEDSNHALTNFELERVLGEIKEKIGRKIDVVGMDACLMSMLEMCYEVRNHLSLAIGSETTVPGIGWPYHRILSELIRISEKEESCTPESGVPCVHAKNLCRIIVDKYIEFYRDYDAETVQLSASNVTTYETLIAALNGLSDLLLSSLTDNDKDGRNAILQAHWRAQSFYEEQYCDLYDFCDLLHESSSNETIKRACENVMAAIDPQSLAERDVENDPVLNPLVASNTEGFVIASGYLSDSLQFSYGLSIYFPWAEVSDRYNYLNFSRDTTWPRFLDAYLEQTGRPGRGTRYKFQQKSARA